MPNTPENSNYPYPENWGCAYAGSDGEQCAVTGCWVKAMLENLKDQRHVPGYKNRVKKFKMEARSHGCKNV